MDLDFILSNQNHRYENKIRSIVPEPPTQDDDIDDYNPEYDIFERYKSLDQIDFGKLDTSLSKLVFLGDDAFLRSQLFSLNYVDQFITRLEYENLQTWFRDDRVGLEDTVLLSAQSQMWIFAIYELLRTWNQRIRTIRVETEKNELKSALEMLRQPLDFTHHGREMRILQYERALSMPDLAERIDSDLRRIRIPFLNIEYIRIALAKHEVAKRPNSIAFDPGYGRFNKYCGSLDYALESGRATFGYLSRRDIADMLRGIWDQPEPPTADEIKEVEEIFKFPDFSDEREGNNT
jgi:hypothetical protein